MSDKLGEIGGVDHIAPIAIPPQILEAAADRQRFDRLAEKWKKETGHLSKVTKRCAHPAYQEVIGMGAGAIPFILDDLKKSRDDWFWALSAITGENPIAEADAGNIPRMTETWLQWAKVNGFSV